MQYRIKTFAAYDPAVFSTPWSAPCDSSGRPNFKGSVAHFTGGREKGGSLFSMDPAEGSAWVCVQKNYRTGHSEKFYVQFRDGAFESIADSEVLSALQSVQQPEMSDSRKDALLTALIKELLMAERQNTAPVFQKIIDVYNISAKELAYLGINAERISDNGNSSVLSSRTASDPI